MLVELATIADDASAYIANHAASLDLSIPTTTYTDSLNTSDGEIGRVR